MRTIEVRDVTAVSGQEVTVPIRFVAIGDENAAGFSIQFDPGLLTYEDVLLGDKAIGCAFNVNTNRRSEGLVGFALARPAGDSFRPGAGELLRVRLRAAAVLSDTTIGFSDRPIVRETVDGSTKVLTTLYRAGVVSITALVPPAFLVQPQGGTVRAGTNLTLTVAASGSTPMRFEWRHNGTNIPGAGGVIEQPNSCMALPDGLLGWWRGEADASDWTGSNPGILRNGALFEQGVVGQAFRFDGADDYVEISDSPLWSFGSGDFSIELWANFDDSSGRRALVASDENGGPYNKWIFWLDGGRLLLHLNGSSGYADLGRVLFAPTPGRWYHLALTRAGSVFSFYIDGALAGTESDGRTVPEIGVGLTIGQAEGGFWFDGLLDEVAIYSRALTGTEVEMIYAAGGEGKCVGAPGTDVRSALRLTNVSIEQSGDYEVKASNWGGSVTSSVARLAVLPALMSPVIVRQPTHRFVSEGEAVVQVIQASGSDPLAYQWLFDGGALAGETNATLVLTHASIGHAGSYAISVSNGAGTVVSQNAILTVSPSPRMLRLGDGAAATGGSVTLPITLLALGEENAVGFSLGFDPSQVRFRGVSLGPDATGMSLQINSNSASVGRVGMAISKPAGFQFAAGTYSLALLEFEVGALSGSYAVTFTNTPVALEVADVWGRSRPIEFQGGTINILSTPPSIVTHPLSQTNRIFSTATLQVGASGSLPLYYQWLRDGMPVPGGTNPVLMLENITPAFAGAYQAVVTNVLNAVTSSVASLAVQRVVRVLGTNCPTGNEVDLPVELLAAGDENSLGFSVRFDPALLTFREAILPAGSPNLTLLVNTNRASLGFVGFAVAEPPPALFRPGTQQVAVVRFKATDTPGTAEVNFGDVPTIRELADAAARPRAAAFVGGGVLTVAVPPVISQHPVPRDVEAGASVTFGVTASGSTPMAYQWRRNGIEIANATNRTFVVANAQPADSGSYGVAIHNQAGSAFSSNAVLTVTLPDTQGPLLTFPRYGSTPLADGLLITNADLFAVTASDPSGVNRVEFYLNDALLSSDNLGTDGFSAFWNVDLFADGEHRIALRAFDSRNNLTALTNNVRLVLAPPPAPVIGLPANGTVVSDMLIAVRGNAMRNSSVVLYRNDVRVGIPTPVSAQGVFETTLTLLNGTNRIQAAAVNRGGEGPRSAVVIAVLDSSVPPAPNSLQVLPRDGGRLLISWVPSLDTAKGYHVYRSTGSFTNKSQAVRLTAGGPTGDTSFLDVPPADGRFFYRVTTINQANTEGALSAEGSAVSDTTPPVALSIQYQPQGRYDATRRLFGRGLVDLTVTMSEPLLVPPFLSLTPNNGVPIVIDLRAGAGNSFLGTFVIDESTPSGLASAVLSARDSAGNRGESIMSGDRISIDTMGPELASLRLEFQPVIRNDSNAPVLLSFAAQLTEALATNTLPQFSYTLSQTSPTPLPIASLSPGSNDLTWIVGFTLPASAGSPSETLTLLFQAEDALGNVGTRIQPAHSFEVYQGDLPPLETPHGLSAKSLPAGAVELRWTSVPGAADYQLYRKASGQPDLVPLVRTGKVLEWVDTPASDGLYQYALASVRRENGQEAVSVWGPVASARSDRIPPGPPSSLVLDLAGNGAFVRWTPPAGLIEAVTYSLYRAASGPISDLSGQHPLFRSIPISQVVDPSPAPEQPYYAVAAVDEAGNISLPSNTGYLNTELLPPSSLAVSLVETNPPVLSWTQSGSTIAGWNLYLGEQGSLARLNPGDLIRTRSYIDSGYNADERLYTVTAVDQNQRESPGRSLHLPRVTVALAPDALVKRGLMNALAFRVQNDSAREVANAQVEVALGGRLHQCPAFSLPAGASSNVTVIVGGYANLSGGVAAMTNTIRISTTAGDTVAIVRRGQVAMGDGQFIVGIMASGLLRGGAASVQFSLLNPGGAELEVLTAQASGGSPSPHVRFSLLDEDGNVLSVAPFKATTGTGIINLPNGDSVLRLNSGAQATSATTLLAIPATTPNRVFLRVEIDRVYFHSDGEDRVEMDGVQTRQEFTVVETSYTGEVTSVSPLESNGDQPVVIAGAAQLRRSGQAAAGVPMVVKIAQGGFVRTEQVLTDAQGRFSTTFRPLPGESGGAYSVWAVHPDLSDGVVQKTFVIRRVLASPGVFTVRAPYSADQSVPITLSTGPGTTVQNLRIEFRPEDQPDGVLPAGVSIDLGEAVPVLGPAQETAVGLVFRGSAEAPRHGTLVLMVTSDESVPAGWHRIEVTYEFSDPLPSLRWSPGFVDTGVAPSNSVLETVTFENVGLASARGLRFALVRPNGDPAPSWAALTTVTALPELAVGARCEVGLLFQPPAGTPEADYEFVLATRAENYPDVDLGVHVAVANSGRGDALFKVVDMFSRSDGTNFLDGVTNALIRLQNEVVSTIQTNLNTDAHGEAWFVGLPAGQYRFQVTADRHQSANGRLWIRAGATANQQVVLTYNLITVEWEVVPIIIQDRYELTLNATFETDVPAPVVTIEPGAINLPQLFAGDVYYGEFSLYNHGLIRADHLQFQLPPSDEYFDYELLTGVPDYLDAKQRIRVPYRLTCKQSLPGPNTPPASGGGAKSRLPRNEKSDRLKEGGGPSGCLSYYRGTVVVYDWVCVNGLWQQGRVLGTYYYDYYGGCPGQSGGTGPVFGGGSGGPSGVTYSRGGTPMPGPQCYPDLPCQSTGVCDPKCTDQRSNTGSWVTLISREFQDEVEDLRVKVPGGEVRVLRQFYENAWHWADAAHHLDLRDISGAQPIVHRGTVAYLAVDTTGSAFDYRGNRIIRADGGYRWRNKDGAWETYDETGRLTASGNRNGTVANYIYDPAGHLVGVADRRDRRIITYHYTGEFPVKATDLSGREVVYEWLNGRLVGVRDPLGNTTTYEYSPAGQMTRKVNRNGTASNIAYDNGGYVYSVLDDQGAGAFYQFHYEANSRQYYAQIRTTAGDVREVTFDHLGAVVARARNGIQGLRVIRDGRAELTTNPNGSTTRGEYDEFDNLLKETNPDGGTVQYAYELQFHQPIAIIDARGMTTVLQYDENGNLVSQVEAFGTDLARTNSWLYREDGLLSRRTDARGNRMDYSYDPDGRLVREFDPDNPAYQTHYGYDLRGNRIALTNALGNVTLYGYDALDRLIAETNALGFVTLYSYRGDLLVEKETGRGGASSGRITRFRYDGRGRLTQTIRVDEQGAEHVWQTTTYNDDGKVVAEANALGQITRYSYNDLGLLAKVARPFSATETSDTQYVYDEIGRLVSSVDPLGVVTHYAYDFMNRQSRVTEAVGTSVQRSRSFGHDLNGNQVSITSSDGTNALTTFYDYDLLNRRIAVRGSREYPQQLRFDAGDNLTGVIDGRGYLSSYAYDQYGRGTNVVEGIGQGQPGEHAGSTEYDLAGNVITAYDGVGNHRHFRHDALGQVTHESVPVASGDVLPGWPEWWTDGNAVLKRTEFNAWGQPTATSNIVGAVTATVYDAFGREVIHTDAAGLSLTNEFNAADQRIAVHYPLVSTAPPGSAPTSIRYAFDDFDSRMLRAITDRANLTTRFGYDKALNRTSERSSWGAVTTFGFDPLGRQTSTTNALGEVTGYAYDQFDQLVATIHPDHIPVAQERIEYRAYDEFGKLANHWGAATYDVRYGYDAAGNQVSLTDGNGNTTRWEYDGRNRRIRKIYADNTFYAYGYNANGRISCRTDAKGAVTCYRHNAFDQPILIDYPTDPDVALRYDALGRPVWLRDATGTNTWHYNSAGSVLTNVQSCADAVLVYEYDTEGRRMSLVASTTRGESLGSTQYRYAQDGRLTSIEDPALGHSPLRYTWSEDKPALSSIEYPSDLRVTHSYDAIARRTTTNVRGSDGRLIHGSAIVFDRASQIVEDRGDDFSASYGYDSKRQLVSEAILPTALTGLESRIKRDYDRCGNCLTVSTVEGTTTFTVNEVNVIHTRTTTSSITLSNDANGNLLWDGESMFRYDDQDRLRSISNRVSFVILEYDGLGRLCHEVDYAIGPSGFVHGDDRKYVYDGWLAVADISVVDQRTRVWRTWGLDVSGSIGGGGGIGGLLAISGQYTGGTSYVPWFDQAGSVAIVMDHETGMGVANYRYDAFGRPLSVNGPAVDSDVFRVATKRTLHSGLVYFGHRYLHTGIGRWCNRDPGGELDGPNLYAYVRNSPLSRYDPLGLAGRCAKEKGCFGSVLDEMGEPCEGPMPEYREGVVCEESKAALLEMHPCSESARTFVFSRSSNPKYKLYWHPRRGPFYDPDHPSTPDGSAQFDYCWLDHEGMLNCGGPVELCPGSDVVCKPGGDQTKYPESEHPWNDRPDPWRTVWCRKCL